MKYKLLVLDIDGTLVDKGGNISAEDKEALANVRQAGIPVSLSTGRAAVACLKIINLLSLDGDHIFFDGALVSNPKQGGVVYIQPLSKAIIEQLIEYARRQQIYLELFTTTSFFVERETWATEIRRHFFDLQPAAVDFNGIWQRESIVKAQLITRSPQEKAKAGNFRRHFDGRLRFSTARTPAYPGVDFINIVASGVSKGAALEALARHLGISLDEVIAVGDGTNDIPLLSTAGLAIAMQDAPAEVRAVADYITLDVAHSGLGEAINRFLL